MAITRFSLSLFHRISACYISGDCSALAGDLPMLSPKWGGLIRLRKQHAWSQEEVAEKIGTTQANLSWWERGVTTPTPYYARKLCELFQKSPEELFPDAPAASAHTASGIT